MNVLINVFNCKFKPIYKYSYNINMSSNFILSINMVNIHIFKVSKLL